VVATGSVHMQPTANAVATAVTANTGKVKSRFSCDGALRAVGLALRCCAMTAIVRAVCPESQ
jgi:hypothetical protein